jgi:hypothetical protein
MPPLRKVSIQTDLANSSVANEVSSQGSDHSNDDHQWYSMEQQQQPPPPLPSYHYGFEYPPLEKLTELRYDRRHETQRAFPHFAPTPSSATKETMVPKTVSFRSEEKLPEDVDSSLSENDLMWMLKEPLVDFDPHTSNPFIVPM